MHENPQKEGYFKNSLEDVFEEPVSNNPQITSQPNVACNRVLWHKIIKYIIITEAIIFAFLPTFLYLMQIFELKDTVAWQIVTVIVGLKIIFSAISEIDIIIYYISGIFLLIILVFFGFASLDGGDALTPILIFSIFPIQLSMLVFFLRKTRALKASKLN